MHPSFLTSPSVTPFQSKSYFLTLSRTPLPTNTNVATSSALRDPPRAVLSEQRPSSAPSLKPLPHSSFEPSAQLKNDHDTHYPPVSRLPHIDEVRRLANARGALGRGVRATLRAFHRRANFVLPRQRQSRSCDQGNVFYVEIGPAYVLTVGQLGSERVTRWAVEQRAWPVLRDVMRWEELSTSEARQRGAPLRKLNMNVRYGRHVFLSFDALATMIAVAEELIADSFQSDNAEQQSQQGNELQPDALFNSGLNVQIEAVIQLRKRPVAGVRTVAVKCPRRDSHRNGDRKPSLLLWMNDDGLTGGAMCPVCMESHADMNSISSNSNAPSSSPRLGSLRHMTWRVHYIQGNTAVLCTPYRRIRSPPHVNYAMNEWKIRNSLTTKQKKSPTKRQKRLRSGKEAAHHSMDENRRSSSSLSKYAVQDQPSASKESLVTSIRDVDMPELDLDRALPLELDENKDSDSNRSSESEASSEPESEAVTNSKGRVKQGSDPAKDSPLGGHVMRSSKRIAQIGKTSSLAYVTALLKIARDADTAWMSPGDSTKLRTVGAKASLACPMQILLWSERQSKGPTSARRVEDVAWYARQSILSDVDDSYDTADGENGVALNGALSSSSLSHSSDDPELYSSPTLNEDAWSRSREAGIVTGFASEASSLSSSSTSGMVESEDWLPTPVVSISVMRVSAWRKVVAASGQLVNVPAGWEPVAQAWLLFDLDDVANLDSDATVRKAASKMTLAVRRNVELSGRCLVLQTGPRGLHVWAELREPRVEPRAWFKRSDTRQWYMESGNKLLRAAHRGGAKHGKVDLCSCSAGRFARRPGWRLLADGSAFRSRVVTYVPSRVKSRSPRM